MKIAFTGSSSTGKTTVANILKDRKIFQDSQYRILSTDNRAILAGFGFSSVDSLGVDDAINFQEAILKSKIDMEDGQLNFLTERSYIDVAAYWISRCKVSVCPFLTHKFVKTCRDMAAGYDVHFYFPIGVIDFKHDGQRSANARVHADTDRLISCLLEDWDCRYVIMDEADVNVRVQKVEDFIVGY